MLLEIDFAKKKKKPAPPLATVMLLYPTGPRPQDTRKPGAADPGPDSTKKFDEHLTLSI